MSYRIEVTGRFRREVKRLLKRYPSLKSEYAQLIESLKDNPEQGSDLGKHCYKIRLAIASKGKGKSGGARVITYIYVSKAIVYLLSIYDKSEKETITNKELNKLLKELES